MIRKILTLAGTGALSVAALLMVMASPSVALPDKIAPPLKVTAKVSKPATHNPLASAEAMAVRYKAVTTSSTAYYRDPLRAISNLQAQRIDAGVDYAGTGPLYALGAGQIVMVYDSGWPYGVFICERLSQGRLAGRYVYYAEDISPAVSVGKHVTTSTVIGHMGSGGIETGWAAPPPRLSDALASDMGESSFPTMEGRKFSWLLHHLGAPAGQMAVSAHLLTASHPAVPRRLRAYDWAYSNAKGCWYNWGGAGPCSIGYDCSGLVMEAYSHVGISLPHNVALMLSSGKLVRIRASDARRGDLVVWGNYHVELVAYRTRWTFGAHDLGTRVGEARTWGAPAYYKVR